MKQDLHMFDHTQPELSFRARLVGVSLRVYPFAEVRVILWNFAASLPFCSNCPSVLANTHSAGHVMDTADESGEGVNSICYNLHDFNSIHHRQA